MFSPKLFHEKLVECGVNFYTGVPDSLLKNFCYYVDDNVSNQQHIIAANEGGALALAIGHHLATGQVPLVYLQNSGFGNLVNPLLSLADNEVYSIPGVLLIGWRGEPGVSDEPQHVKQGRVSLELLDTMEIPYRILGHDMTEDEILNTISNCVESAKSESSIYALVVKKGFFEKYLPEKSYESVFELTREKAIQLVVDHYKEGLIVSTTGLASRELYEYRSKTSKDHSRDFLVVGGMGHANQIATGLALYQPNRRVICLDGDGAIIMQMGSMPIIGSIKPKNLLHILLNNGAHDSVGGQETAGLHIELSAIARNSGYPHVFSCTTEEDVLSTLPKIDKLEGPIFFEIKVKKGFRSEIGRPETTPLENKINFISQLM